MFVPMLFLPRKRVQPLAKLLQVGWITTDAAPLATPYIGQIGFVLNVDTNSIIGASAGVLTVNGTAAANDRVVSANSAAAAQSYTRVSGRYFRIFSQLRTTVTGGATKFGFDGTATANSMMIGWDWNSTTAFRIKEGVTAIRSVTMSSSAVSAVAVMRNPGGRVITKDGAGTPQLQWIYPSNSAVMFAKMILSAATINVSTGEWDVDTSAALNGDYVDASVHTTPSISGTIVTAQADGFFHTHFTLPAVSANLVAVEQRYRVTDANNYYTLYLKGNVGGTAWDLLFDKVVAGVHTNLKTTTGVGTPQILITWTSGSAFEHYTDTGTATTQRDTGTDSTYTTQTGFTAVWDASVTIGSEDSWTLTNSLYTELFT